jgi:hypothetical protein
MTIQQTIDIPASRRLYLELPDTAPTGHAEIQLTISLVPPHAKAAPGDERLEKLLKPFPSLEELKFEELKREAAEKTLRRLADPANDPMRKYAGCLKDSSVFEGDPVDIQREMRDEWPN